jgi:predicted AlkP superfamily pyrophosphatase or phosphodiesterase
MSYELVSCKTTSPGLVWGWLRRLLISAAVVVCSAAVLARAQSPAPILVLISIDGFRYDYFDRADLPNLKSLAARGVRSQGLIPSFPSVTFPNHYTIVTGLVPDHHGIVANAMFDRSIGPAKFTMSSATAKNPAWWGGEPIWMTAIKQGHKSAAMFWPGSEAVKPTYWRPFDDNLSNEARVAQVLDWMKLPEADRPVFTTLYFDDVDHAGHDLGPDTPEVLGEVVKADQAIGQLLRGMDSLGLTSRTTYVIVSDHGMATTSNDRLIYLDDYLDPSELDVVEWSPIVEINPPSTMSADALYRKLANKHPALGVYKREGLPTWLQYGRHPRIPAIVGIAELGWTVTTRADAAAQMKTARGFKGGAHGYDPRYRELHGLFIAAGGRIRKGVIVPEFQNTHIYNLMCEVLGLTPAPNDGDFSQVAKFIDW